MLSQKVLLLGASRRPELRRLAAEGLCVRAYIRYGVDWYGYSMRRLAERPANLRSLVSTS